MLIPVGVSLRESLQSKTFYFMINPANVHQSSEQHYQHACLLMIDEGKSVEITKAELLKRGMTHDSADDMISNVLKQMELEKKHQSNRRSSMLRMFVIIFWVIIQIYKCSR
jgi:hypothetical protein